MLAQRSRSNEDQGYLMSCLGIDLLVLFVVSLFPSQRLFLCIIIFFGHFVMQLMRNILSLGIVCMTIESDDQRNNTNSSEYVHNTKWTPGTCTFPKRKCTRIYPV